MEDQREIILDLLKRSKDQKRFNRKGKIIKSWLKYPEDIGTYKFPKKVRILYGLYCHLESMACFDIASYNLKGDIFHYFFKDAEEIMGTPYAYLEHSRETFPAYCLIRWRMENPKKDSYFDDVEEDEVICSDFNFELVKRGYKIGGSHLGGEEKDYEHLPRIFPDFGRRLVVVTAMIYAGAGNNHWYMKIKVESNSFYEIDKEKKEVRIHDPWRNTDGSYTMEEKFNTHKQAFDWVDKMKAENFPEDVYIVIRGIDPMTKHFYRKEGD